MLKYKIMQRKKFFFIPDWYVEDPQPTPKFWD